jgi:exodeoxyribonuclease VII large subunit
VLANAIQTCAVGTIGAIARGGPANGLRHAKVRRMPQPTPSAPAGAERNVFTVSRLNRDVRLLLERGLGVVWVEGELSNFSAPASGHWYFSLKDRDAQVRCAMFRQRNMTIGFTPKSGQQVLVRARVGLYEPRGDYQLIAEHLEEAGVGALKREFERLKAALDKEGLFALERKRELPRFPKRIGVVTSRTGAAIRDILHILRRRFPPAAVLIYPTAVQGAAAVPDIIAAINLASARRECDVLIVARGGGSIEDLWAFNDEHVARAIHACAIPVVSGIGHEIDFTIADFVADARAPTPSGAAELVAPDRRACLEALANTSNRLALAIRRELHSTVSLFESLSARLKQAHPGMRMLQQEQRLDDLEQRLAGALRASLHNDRRRLSDAVAGLIRHSPDRLVREMRLRSDGLKARLNHSIQDQMAKAEHRMNLAVRTLDTVSPLATMSRGFAIITRASDGALLTDASAASIGEEIDAKLAKGTLRARVVAKE